MQEKSIKLPESLGGAPETKPLLVDKGDVVLCCMRGERSEIYGHLGQWGGAGFFVFIVLLLIDFAAFTVDSVAFMIMLGVAVLAWILIVLCVVWAFRRRNS